MDLLASTAQVVAALMMDKVEILNTVCECLLVEDKQMEQMSACGETKDGTNICMWEINRWNKCLLVEDTTDEICVNESGRFTASR